MLFYNNMLIASLIVRQRILYAWASSIMKYFSLVVKKKLIYYDIFTF